MEKSSTFALFSFFPPPGFPRFFYHTQTHRNLFSTTNFTNFMDSWYCASNTLSVISVISVWPYLFRTISLFRIILGSNKNPRNPWSQEVPLHKLIHGHYTDNRKRSVLKGIEVRILWNDHISTRSKSTIHKLVIIRVRRNNPQTKVWVNESHVSLVNQKEHDILCNLCGCLLFKNFLILFQYIVRDTTGRMFILGYL